MRFVVQLVAVSLVAISGSCALIDSLSGDDDVTDPGREDSGPEPFGNCGQALILGDLSNGAAVGPFNSCEGSIDLDFSPCEPSPDFPASGIIIGFLVDEGEYEICVSAGAPGLFAIREGSCSETPIDRCDMSNACTTEILGPGPVHLYWEPNEGDICGDVGFDINPIFANDG